MIGLRDLCVALIGGGLISGTAVVVADAAQSVSARQIQTRPVVHRKAPPRNTQRPAPAPIIDCPIVLPSPGIGPFSDVPLPPMAGGDHPFPIPVPGAPPILPGIWDGGGVFPPVAPPPTLSAVPEAPVWIMTIAGFGLIGLSVRRGRHEAR